MEIVRGLFGLAVLIGIAFIFSKHKKKVNWKLVGSGVAIQLIQVYWYLKFLYSPRFLEFLQDFLRSYYPLQMPEQNSYLEI